MKILKAYFIAVLLMIVICSPALAGGSRGRSDTAEKEIKNSVAAIGQTGKEAGTIIGHHFKEFGKQTGKVLKDMAKAFREAVQKDLR